MKTWYFVLLLLLILVLTMSVSFSTTCNCTSCSSCNNALSNNTCSTVYLLNNISLNSTCINSFSNKTFDCQNHSIVGDGGLSDYGIFLNNSNNSTLKNCKISNFGIGILILNSSKVTIENYTISKMNSTGIQSQSSRNLEIFNSTIYKSDFGITFNSTNNSLIKNNTLYNNSCNNPRNSSIYIYNSFNDTLMNNFIYYSGTGIYVSNKTSDGHSSNKSIDIDIENNQIINNSFGIQFEGSNGTINGNVICKNLNYDLYSINWNGTSGSENTCNKPDDWNDTNYNGCTWPCNSTCNCGSCSSCGHLLTAPHSCAIVKLNQSITSSSCISTDSRASNKILDCDNHIVSGGAAGDTFLSAYKSNPLTVQNCIISSFEYGVFRPYKSNLTFINSVFTRNTFAFFEPQNTKLNINNSEFYKNRVGIFIDNSFYGSMNISNTNFNKDRCSFYFNDYTKLNLSLTNTFINGFKGVSALNKNGCEYSNVGFFYLYNTTNCKIYNSNLQNRCPGGILIDSNSNYITNIKGNGGIYFKNSSSNLVSNIDLYTPPWFGLKLYNSNNTIKNVKIFAPKDFDDAPAYGIYEENSNNSFNNISIELSPDLHIESQFNGNILYPIRTQMVNTYYYKPAIMNHFLNNVPIFNNTNIKLNFTMYYPNGSMCTNYSYSLKIDGINVTNYSIKNGKNVLLNYTINTSGYHTAELNLTEYYNGSSVKMYQTYPIFVKNYTFYNYTYYFRSNLPHLYQPTGGILSDSGSYLTDKPYENERIHCIWWVQASPDKIIYSIPTIIKSIYAGLWEHDGTYFALQRYVFYGKGGDINKPVTDGWNDILFKDINYIISNPQEIYAISFNLWFQTINQLGNVTLYTKPNKPTYSTFEIVKPSKIIEFNSSGLNLTIDYIKYYRDNITMRLFGNSQINTTIRLNYSHLYVLYNDKVCPNDVCIYKYNGTELKLSANITNNVTIVIGNDTALPLINCLNRKDANESKIPLEFTSRDNISSFSYLGFDNILTLPFDSGNGQIIYDKSSNTSTFLGSTPSIDKDDPEWINSIWGHALNFNGYDNYIYFPKAISINGGITISMWIKPQSYKNYSWKMFGGYSTHNGTTNDKLISNNTLWTYNLHGLVSSSPIFDSEKVFVSFYNASTNSGEIIAINGENGNRVWNISKSTPIKSLIVDNGNVFFANDNKLYAVDENNGNTKWVFNSNNKINSMVISKKVIYIVANNIYAVNETNGNLIWNKNLSTNFSSNALPMIANGILYISSSNSGKIYALDSHTGKLIWKTKLGNSSNFSTLVYSDHLIYVSTNESGYNRLYVIDEDGNILWESQALDTVPTGYHIPAPVVDDKYVYLPWIHNIYVFNKYNGSLMWYDPIGVNSSSLIISNNILYIGSDDGYLYALNKLNGTIIWKSKIGDSCLFPIIANQKLYVGSTNGSFYSFGKKRSDLGTMILIGSKSNTVGYHWLYLNEITKNLEWQYTNGYSSKTVYCHVPWIYDGKWHLITVSHNYNSRAIKFYVDGNLSCEYSTDFVKPIVNQKIYVGSYKNNSYFFDGGIDQVMVWNRILSKSEVSALFNSKDKSFEALLNLKAGMYNYIAFSVDESGNYNDCTSSVVVHEVKYHYKPLSSLPCFNYQIIGNKTGIPVLFYIYKNKGIRDINVSVYQNSTFISSGLTNKSGFWSYKFDNPGNYLIKFHKIGYCKKQTYLEIFKPPTYWIGLKDKFVLVNNSICFNIYKNANLTNKNIFILYPNQTIVKFNVNGTKCIIPRISGKYVLMLSNNTKVNTSFLAIEIPSKSVKFPLAVTLRFTSHIIEVLVTTISAITSYVVVLSRSIKW